MKKKPSPPSVQPETRTVQIVRLQQGQLLSTTDVVAAEEALAMSIAYGESGRRQVLDLGITMRTPGHDIDLLGGYLVAEGLVAHKQQLLSIKAIAGENGLDAVHAELSPELAVNADVLEQTRFRDSSCGLCGKASAEALQGIPCYFPQPGYPVFAISALLRIPELLRQSQPGFSQTGGLHAAALLDANGGLLLLREDVGRHNALDKLVGAALANGMLPLRQNILALSGRIGFELVQKAAMAGIPLVAAIGAPSSRAIDAALEAGITLIGFLKKEQFNVYSYPERIV